MYDWQQWYIGLESFFVYSVAGGGNPARSRPIFYVSEYSGESGSDHLPGERTRPVNGYPQCLHHALLVMAESVQRLLIAYWNGGKWMER